MRHFIHCVANFAFHSQDSVTGDCSTSIEISRLPYAQVFASAGFKLESFDDVCGSKPVYQILKTKDFNNCKTNPAWHTTTSNSYECDLDKANCGHFLKVIKNDLTIFYSFDVLLT